MDGDRSTAVLVHPDQWARCVHADTRLVDGGGVALNWFDNETVGTPPPPAPAAGLAFDRWSRSYRAWPGLGRVTAAEVGRTGGSPTRGLLRRPQGLAVDGRQRLYVAETGARAVHVVDLRAPRLLRRVALRRAPLDVAGGCCGATVLVGGPEPELVRVDGRRGPFGRSLPCAPGAGLRAVRVTGSGAVTLLLWTGDGPGVVARPDGTVVVSVDAATDVELVGDLLVVARGPGRALRRFRRTDGRWAEVEPLGAPGYDGAAIAAAPDGRIAVTTAAGFGWTSGAQVRYAPTGRVVGYRLDAGAYRARWGRVFLDACLPRGTDVRLRFVTTDEDVEGTADDALPWTPPSRPPGRLPDPEVTPPQAPSAALAAADGPWPLHRRATGREWPWAQVAPDDPLETYEAPVQAPPGRYLWIALELRGGGTTTPRVRALRAERPGHRLLQQLPRGWSRSEPDAAAVHRFLAPAEGVLHELDERAAARALLLDPTAAPQEVLGWLAGLVGLVADGRWPERARRALIAEAFALFRVRGTVACLERLLQLYLGTPVTVMDDWRLRGLAGAVLGAAGGARPPAIGGAAGSLGGFVVGGQQPGADGYTAAAHRFTVLVPGRLDEERRAVVRSVVDAHKPAHTLGRVCELGAGMRVGRQCHAGLTTVVGPGPDREPPLLGEAVLGGDVVVGSPAVGARVGTTSRVGEVRVG